MRKQKDKTQPADALEVTKVYRSQKATEKFGFAWSVISVIYTIAMVIFFISSKWVPSEFSVALVVLLVAWVVVFIVIIAIAINNRDAKGGRKALGIYKKGIKIFKYLVNILFLVITIVSMTGIARQGGLEGAKEIAIVVVYLLVAIVQLAAQIALIVVKAVMKHKGKNMVVQAVTFVNGKSKNDKFRAKVLSKIYHTETDAPTAHLYAHEKAGENHENKAAEDKTSDGEIEKNEKTE